MRALRRLWPSALRGGGSAALAATLGAQLLAAVLVAHRPLPPPPPVAARTLSASVVVDAPFGAPARALAPQDQVPAGSRLQLSFEPGEQAWVAVLWFEGDRVVPLYPDPARGHQGWTRPTAYAVPAPGAWLRVTATDDADFVAVVSSLRPDPGIERVLMAPTPGEVAALRGRLERLATARRAAPSGVERFLPTPDGRSVAAPWRTVVGTGPLVLGWHLDVVTATPSAAGDSAETGAAGGRRAPIPLNSPAWLDPTTSSSSEQASPERWSPSAS